MPYYTDNEQARVGKRSLNHGRSQEGSRAGTVLIYAVRAGGGMPSWPSPTGAASASGSCSAYRRPAVQVVAFPRGWRRCRLTTTAMPSP